MPSLLYEAEFDLRIIMSELMVIGQLFQIKYIKKVKWMWTLFGKDFRVATLSRLCSTVSGIPTPSFKNLG